MRKNLTWFTVEEVYCTTSLEEADATRPGDAGGCGRRWCYLRQRFLQDNPNVELEGSAFWSFVSRVFPGRAWISRRLGVGPHKGLQDLGVSSLVGPGEAKRPVRWRRVPSRHRASSGFRFFRISCILKRISPLCLRTPLPTPPYFNISARMGLKKQKRLFSRMSPSPPV